MILEHNIDSTPYMYYQAPNTRFIRGCMLCCTNKPSNMKHGLHHPLHVPTRPWERISVDFVRDLPTIRKGHDYLFLVVDRFNKICVMMSYKNTISEHQATNLFFGKVQVHFWIPRTIVSNKETIFFLVHFGIHCRRVWT